MGQKRISGGSNGGSYDVFSEHERQKLMKAYPRIELTGKNNELYKCTEVL